jgi:hypothetical protein
MLKFIDKLRSYYLHWGVSPPSPTPFLQPYFLSCKSLSNNTANYTKQEVPSFHILHSWPLTPF